MSTRMALGLLLGLAACAGAPPSPPKPNALNVPAEPSAKPADESPKAEARAPGTRELVAELLEAERIAEPERRWFETKRILETIRTLADPRGADALATYVANAKGWPSDPERVFRRTVAALALGELGDLRAVPALAERLLLDPLNVYQEEAPGQAELRRTDIERVMAARVIADLATLHPAEHARIRKEAQDSVRRWLDSAPSPHANGLRALARMQVEDDTTKTKLRAWADPPGDLPKPGAMPPFDDKWIVAQSALRYTGALRDEKSWAILEKQLARKPKKADVTTDGLLAGGMAMLGMTVRALALGAADGFAEWGDARAVPKLLAHVEDDKQNEQSRLAACRALGLVLGAKDEPELSKRLEKWKASTTPAGLTRLTCLLETLHIHPVAAATPPLLELLGGKDVTLARAASRALGYAGLDAAGETALVARLTSAETRTSAAVALLLGGSPEAARRAVAAFAEEPDLSELNAAYYQALDPASQADLSSGRLFRFVRNARGLLALTREQQPVDFARKVLAGRLREGEYDSGPGSLTRVLLRKRLFDLGRTGSADERASALDTLELIGERGVLLALGSRV